MGPEKDFQPVAGTQSGKSLLEPFERNIVCDEAGLDELLRQTFFQNLPHQVPCLEYAASDDTVDRDTAKNHVPSKIHLHYSRRKPEKRDRTAHPHNAKRIFI